MPRVAGFFGKLPARGDFVTAGLPRDFVSRWDSWICSVLPTALDCAGDDWLLAKVWRFSLAPGLCGNDPAIGVLLPSIDKVGRRFPLTLAWLGDEVDTFLLDVAEQVGHTVIDDALAPDVLVGRLANLSAGADRRTTQPASGSLWRHAGLHSLLLPGLPDAATFATMTTGKVP